MQVKRREGRTRERNDGQEKEMKDKRRKGRERGNCCDVDRRFWMRRRIGICAKV